jgi:hypothetical protein
MKPPVASVERAAKKAVPAWIVFPTFALGETMRLEPQSKAATFIELANNAFNYHAHGRRGFELLAATVDRCACLSLTYSDLDAAIGLFERLTEDASAAA